MIVTEGGRFGGYGLFLSKGELGIGRGKVVFLYNLLGMKHIAWEGPELKPGKHTIAFDFKYDGPGFGKGGTGTLSVDGTGSGEEDAGEHDAHHVSRRRDFDVGMDTRTPVSLIEYHYDCPFKFTGKIDKLHLRARPGAVHGSGAEGAPGHCRPGCPREGLSVADAMTKALIFAAVGEITTGTNLRPTRASS